MKSSRNLLERFREERRVRREFDRLIAREDWAYLNTLVRGEREERPKSRRFWPRGWKFWVPFVSLVMVVAMTATVLAVLYAPLPFDPPAPMQTSFVYDRSGTLLARLRPDEDRVVVPIARIPKVLQDAVIAAEDERFYEHPGVDFWAIVRAAWHDLTGRGLEGGSTITQQLVKQYYVGRERSLGRKLKEAVLAVRLERRFNKREILARYLNAIYLGNGAYGVEAASRTYFDKPVEDVTLAEAALLASIIPRPARFNPREDVDGARARRDHVLDRMVSNRLITSARAREAKRDDIVLAPEQRQRFKAPYFVEWVRDGFLKRHPEDGEDLLNRAGLQFHTTIDLKLQHAAERAVRDVLNQPGDPEASLVSIDVRTGAVRAMVGGRSFYSQPFNLATQGHRQSGSAFKPFVLATALDEGMSPHDSFYAPGTIHIGGWSPSNYDGRSYGTISLRTATVNSVNTVYAQVIDEVGARDVARTARRLGIRTSHLDEDNTLTLGTSSVSPIEMTSAFATLASGGVYHAPTGVSKVVDEAGEVLERLGRPAGKRVLDGEVAGQVSAILQEVVRYGTGTSAALDGYAVAGKTGTTDQHTDAWFCGYTSELATCVWVGHRAGRIPMEDVHGIRVTGGSFPAQIWRAFMSQAPLPAEPIDVADLYGSPSGGSFPTTAPTSAPPPEEEPGPGEPTTPPPPEPSPTGGGLICILGCG